MCPMTVEASFRSIHCDLQSEVTVTSRWGHEASHGGSSSSGSNSTVTTGGGRLRNMFWETWRRGGGGGGGGGGGEGGKRVLKTVEETLSFVVMDSKIFRPLLNICVYVELYMQCTISMRAG